MTDTTLIKSYTSLTSLATSKTDTLSTLTTTSIQSVPTSTKITVSSSYGMAKVFNTAQIMLSHHGIYIYI